MADAPFLIDTKTPASEALCDASQAARQEFIEMVPGGEELLNSLLAEVERLEEEMGATAN